MAEFKFSCPQCAQRIQCDTGYGGTQINCPTCKQLILVPQAPRSPAAPPAPPSMPSTLATQRPTSTPSVPTVGMRAAAKPIVPKKDSGAMKMVLAISAVVVALAVLGGGGWYFYSKHKANENSSAENSTAQNETPSLSGDAPGSNVPSGAVLDLLVKVHQAYTNLASLHAEGSSVTVIDMSGISAADMAAAQSGGTKKIKNQKPPAIPKSQTITSDISVMLARPDLYRIETKMKMGSSTNSFTSAVWSSGKGDFMFMGKKYTQFQDRNTAFMTASSSGGLAMAMPELFFGEASEMGKFIRNWAKGDDDTLDGQDCYTLTATMMGQQLKLWVNKASCLFVQSQVTLGGKVSDADMEEAFNAFNTKTNVPQARLDQMKAQARQQAAMMSKIKGTVTETYDTIEVNKTFTADDFDYPVPANVKLTPSKF